MRIYGPLTTRYLAALGATLVLAVATGGCATNPVTGQPQLALISESQEVDMGRKAAEETRQSIGLVKNDRLQSYVQDVGIKLAADSERPQLPWSFQVVDDATPNAFALPGGFIFVTRGLMTYMDSEAELAAVLGHEIGHVTARHSVQQISRAQLAQLGLGVGMILAPELQQLGGALSSGLQLLFLKYGRDAERQADALGFRYALHENYDVREMDDVFETLQALAKQQHESPLPTWAATHPDEGERIATVQRRLAQLPPGSLKDARVGTADYLTHIDGLTFGENPRNGFFKGSRFLQPDLAFQITFPEGWKTQNLPQSVAGVSPQQDGAIELTLASATPEQAARQFLGQQGIQAGNLSPHAINGLAGVVAQFAAQTQQGNAVQGLVAFVPLHDQTYRIIGYAPAARFPEMERTLLTAIDSFAPLTDPEALHVQPKRIDIVKLPRAMTLQEFAHTYPSTADVQTLALLNQVPNGSAQLAAGKLMKRVVEGNERLTSADEKGDRGL